MIPHIQEVLWDTFGGSAMRKKAWVLSKDIITSYWMTGNTFRTLTKPKKVKRNPFSMLNKILHIPDSDINNKGYTWPPLICPCRLLLEYLAKYLSLLQIIEKNSRQKNLHTNAHCTLYLSFHTLSRIISFPLSLSPFLTLKSLNHS